MASAEDLRRGRDGTRRMLDDLDSLSLATQTCRDDSLLSLLTGIRRRKAGQTARLMDWLARQEDGLQAPAIDPDASGGSEGETAKRASKAVETDASPSARSADPVRRPPTAEAGVIVIERLQITPELLIFKVPRPLDFSFSAGQSVKVGLGDITRSYSIASAPHEPVLEFFVELVPGGRMSERLRRLSIGDRISLGSAKGDFLLEPSYRNHLMVATVTGINPFISMLRDCVHRNLKGYRFHILHGASYQAEFGYREELDALASDHPELLTYVPSVSRPDEAANAGWTGSVGRVDTIIANYLDRTGLDAGSTMLYICGHSGMIDLVERNYRPLGFRIKTEDYD
ncbi:MAG: hypothetical protein KGY54_12430 [Oleiphilaceae bacterium]|nr:hypothetical protein [Oleiphilaceae bacterium]